MSFTDSGESSKKLETTEHSSRKGCKRKTRCTQNLRTSGSQFSLVPTDFKARQGGEHKKGMLCPRPRQCLPASHPSQGAGSWGRAATSQRGWKYLECGGRPKDHPVVKMQRKAFQIKQEPEGEWLLSGSAFWPGPGRKQSVLSLLDETASSCIFLHTWLSPRPRTLGTMLSYCLIFGGDRKHPSHVRENSCLD